MGIKSLGIDISDGCIAGVVLEQQRKAPVLISRLNLPLPEGADCAAVIRDVCAQLEWREGVCVCGLPFSMLSVRNLILPFNDVKKIAQALPFELEEQLIVPLDAVTYDFCPSRRTDQGSLIVAFAVEKELLGGLLEALQGAADPDAATPAMAALADQISARSRDGGNFLVAHADLHSTTMAFVVDKVPIFYRRLSHPEQMILHPPFVFVDGEATVVNAEAAEECVRLLSQAIGRSLDYFRTESREQEPPERVLLAGPLAGVEGMADILASSLGLPVEMVDLLRLARISCTAEQREQWRNSHDDRALALSLQGLKKGGVNLRRQAFAKKRSFYASRKQLVAAVAAVVLLLACGLGYTANDYRRLQRRDKALGDEMTAIFKSAFPGVVKIQDPYVEMQSRLKAAHGPGAPTPMVLADRRTLDLLADVSARIPETLALRVSRLSIDRESVLIKGTTDTFNSVETIKSLLAASPKYKSVQIVSATADKEKKNGAIRFEVQLQLEGI